MNPFGSFYIYIYIYIYVNWLSTIITLNMKFHKSTSSLSNKLGLLKILCILNNCYSLGRPIGLRNYLPLILMVLIKGGNLDRNTALITTIE